MATGWRACGRARWANQGIYTNKAGAVYEGNWEFNMRHGPGKLRMTSGKVYVGNFQNNKQDGQGK